MKCNEKRNWVSVHEHWQFNTIQIICDFFYLNHHGIIHIMTFSRKWHQTKPCGPLLWFKKKKNLFKCPILRQMAMRESMLHRNAPCSSKTPDSFFWLTQVTLYYLYIMTLTINFKHNFNRSMVKLRWKMTFTSTFNTFNDFLTPPPPSPLNPGSATQAHCWRWLKKSFLLVWQWIWLWTLEFLDFKLYCILLKWKNISLGF